MSIGGVKGGFRMVRDAKKDVVITPKDLESFSSRGILRKASKLGTIDDPIFKKLIKDYGKSIRNGSKGKILEKIVFNDGSCYYVIKGSNFKDGRREQVLNKVKVLIKQWKECEEDKKTIIELESAPVTEFNSPLASIVVPSDFRKIDLENAEHTGNLEQSENELSDSKPVQKNSEKIENEKKDET